MHVIVTGASSGIGESLARAFAADGADLTLVARRAERLHALAAALGPRGRVNVVVADLSDPERATEVVAAAIAALGPVDVLVNNAGVQIVGATTATDPAEGERLLATNLMTPLRLTRAVLPSMIARGAGTIVDVASMAALAPTPGMTWYNASKAGLAAASEAMRGELRGTGVHVLTVYPGIIDTPMADAAIVRAEPSRMLALQPHGDPDVLASLVTRAVRTRRARVVYPRVNWLARWFPGATRCLLDRYTPAFRAAA